MTWRDSLLHALNRALIDTIRIEVQYLDIQEQTKPSTQASEELQCENVQLSAMFLFIHSRPLQPLSLTCKTQSTLSMTLLCSTL